MSSKIYVGNLPYSVTDTSLKSNFAEFGGVTSAKVMMDRDTGESKGSAISALNGVSVDGRRIVVSLARPREERAAPGAYSATGYRASNRPDVGYGNGGFGGGRY